MSNLTIFDRKYLESLLERFAPGMAAHIIPIKYEALTPDCFLLLFRTTAQNGEYHYFVSLETDSQHSLDGARCTIEDWHGNEVIAFWPLQEKRGKEDAEKQEDFQVATQGAYLSMLAEVKPPTHKGYWARSITIMPGDRISDKIKDYTEQEQVAIRKALVNVLQHKTDPNVSFLAALQAKKRDTIVDDINQTDIAVSLYVQPDGSVESFYNYVHRTIGNRPRKTGYRKE